MKPPPEELVRFVQRFSDSVSAPLCRSPEGFSVDQAAYDSELMADVDRADSGPRRMGLASYNTQYWFRLFDVMQNELPLTARLVGFRTFNTLVEPYLREPTARTARLEVIADGFQAFVRRTRPSVRAKSTKDPLDLAMLLETISVDDAFRRAVVHETRRALDVRALDASRLELLRLTLCPTLSLVRESRALVEARRALSCDDGRERISLPPRHARPRWLLLFRRGGQIGELPVSDFQAELHARCLESAVGPALRAASARFPKMPPVAMRAEVERYFADVAQLDLLVGVSDARGPS